MTTADLTADLSDSSAACRSLQRHTKQHIASKWRSGTYLILLTVALGIAADALLYSIFIPVLPFVLKDRFGLDDNDIQRYLSILLAVYAGACALTSPIGGALMDRKSTPQTAFLAGVLISITGTTIFYFGYNIWILICGRIVQGVGSALLWTAGFAICSETVGPSRIGTISGTLYSLSSLCNLCSPPIGGVIFSNICWEGIYYFSCPILVCDLVLYTVAIRGNVFALNKYSPETCADHDARDAEHYITSNQVDHEQQPLLQGQREHDFTHERRRNQPMLIRAMPLLASLKSCELTFALILGLTQQMLIGIFEATIPMIARNIFNLNPAQTSLMFLPLSLLHVLSAPVFGLLVDKYGPRPIVFISYAYLSIISALFRTPLPDNKTQFRLFNSLTALSGIGLGAASVPAAVIASTAIEAMRLVSPHNPISGGYYGQMFGLLDFSYWTGLTIGPLLGGYLQQIVGFGPMTSILAIICGGIAFACPICMT